MALTDKQRRFVEEYPAQKFNATAAAIAAGFSERSAKVKGSQLLAMPEIAEALADHLAKLASKAAVTVETIAGQLHQDRQLAHRVGMPGAAVSASMGLAKLYGLIIDKKAETTPDGQPLPPAEIRVTLVKADHKRGDTGET